MESTDFLFPDLAHLYFIDGFYKFGQSADWAK